MDDADGENAYFLHITHSCAVETRDRWPTPLRVTVVYTSSCIISRMGMLIPAVRIYFVGALLS
ncbi:MAG: hypothetical protein M1472_01920 [Planctomycetes bacterium]|nr:hypothetical protein [Planctomycetota bacterium]